MQPSPAPSWDWGPGGPPATGAAAAAGQADAPGEPPLPGPDQEVGYAAYIKPLFRQRDRQSMSFAFDPWSYPDVKTRANDILARLQNGSMPCDGAWPAAKIEVFQRWTETGMRPSALPSAGPSARSQDMGQAGRKPDDPVPVPPQYRPAAHEAGLLR